MAITVGDLTATGQLTGINLDPAAFPATDSVAKLVEAFALALVAAQETQQANAAAAVPPEPRADLVSLTPGSLTQVEFPAGSGTFVNSVPQQLIVNWSSVLTSSDYLIDTIA